MLFLFPILSPYQQSLSIICLSSKLNPPMYTKMPLYQILSSHALMPHPSNLTLNKHDIKHHKSSHHSSPISAPLSLLLTIFLTEPPGSFIPVFSPSQPLSAARTAHSRTILSP
ncbi:hypothetical protein TRIATDRAFT_297583 [Trichoderma atroviride IMI 206040]|uniref:Uncharacterized protein n=1 Tax=Hypocrea atroviridis (strain ATCC 20476 / IMI 206040) TaxID=452589 RepID=G9NIR1_HYPAI|nr:uncharacterized protein TRIATDRAFT_297583 [Trichoderma atroviride IMI 206040]EHK49671.1 hypothetical protein TRIATDRAFT_297583 [Trichoderma atroviride IMI 206040]